MAVRQLSSQSRCPAPQLQASWTWYTPFNHIPDNSRAARQIASIAEDSANSRSSFMLWRFLLNWSGRLDSNQRPPAPKAGALPGCATPRHRTGGEPKLVGRVEFSTASAVTVRCASRQAAPGRIRNFVGVSAYDSHCGLIFSLREGPDEHPDDSLFTCFASRYCRAWL